MLSSELFSTMENYARQSFYHGRNDVKPWGNLPILLLVGDDFQLPPIMPGAFDATTSLNDQEKLLVRRNEKISSRVALGEALFLETGRHVMVLKSTQRVQQSQHHFKQILQGLRSADNDTLSDEDVRFLATNFHLLNPHFSDQDRANITKDALFLFANRAPRDFFNRIRLQETHSPTNPVAKIKAVTMKNGVVVGNNSHYDDSVPASTNLCRNARVSISGCNIRPSWGLYNGSIGTVVEIVFHPGESPNNGNQPAYVLVEFLDYCGPPFLPNFPKLVPIVHTTVQCDKNSCCQRTFIPLTLAFGKTVHTFQGQNAGPVDEGKPPNSVQRIICDPGTRSFEGTNIGLFYTILSRATTLGTTSDDVPPSDRFKDSAIYFIGNNMNQARIRKITTQINGQPYKKVSKRTAWVNHLKQYTHQSGFSETKKRKLFSWATTTQVSREQLKAIIKHHST